MKLTPDVQKRLCDGINLGAPIELAAKYAGVAYDTVHRWVVEGNNARARWKEALLANPDAPKPKDPFFVLVEALEQAEGAAVARWLSIIEAAAKKSWPAAAWKLERIHSERYALKQRHEVTAPGGVPVVNLNVDAKDKKAVEIYEALLNHVADARRPTGPDQPGGSGDAGQREHVVPVQPPEADKPKADGGGAGAV